MRLFEAIIEANHRAAAGDSSAGLHPADFADELPLAALTCIDARLNPLLPEVLGLPAEQFIWLRNAGNIITSTTSSTVRSLSLACAVKGAESIAIIGHTDCQVGKTTTLQLLERLKELGVERHSLPDNLTEFFGMFGSERQNVLKACDFARRSPLLGTKVCVHGLLLDITTGRLEWILNGYQPHGSLATRWNAVVESAEATVDKLKTLTDFNMGEMKFPETKIGESVVKAEDWLAHQVESLKVDPTAAESSSPAASATHIAEQIVHLAEKNWPQPRERRPPPVPRKVATPPRLSVPNRPRDPRSSK